MDEGTYQLLAMGGIALIGAGAKIYYNQKQKNTIQNFVNKTNNYFLPQIDMLQETINDFKKSSSTLVNKLKIK